MTKPEVKYLCDTPIEVINKDRIAIGRYGMDRSAIKSLCQTEWKAVWRPHWIGSYEAVVATKEMWLEILAKMDAWEPKPAFKVGDMVECKDGNSHRYHLHFFQVVEIGYDGWLKDALGVFHDHNICLHVTGPTEKQEAKPMFEPSSCKLIDETIPHIKRDVELRRAVEALDERLKKLESK